MRAIGTSRRQVRQMIRYESVITALIGGVFGLVIGVVGAVLVTTFDALGLGLRAVISRRHADHPARRRRARRPARRAAAGAPRGAPGRAQRARQRVAALARCDADRGRAAPPWRSRSAHRAAIAKLPAWPQRPPPSRPTPSSRRPPGTSSRSSTARARTASSGAWPRRSSAPRRSRSATPASSASSTAPAWREAMRELGEIQSWSAAPATTPRCASPPTPPIPRNGALLQRVQEQETAIQTTLLFFELEWAALADERAEELLAGEGLDFCAPPPAQRAPLSRAPAVRARGEDPRREVAHRRERVDAPVRGADLGDRGRAARQRRGETVALDVALSRLSLADRELRRTTAEAVTAALAPGLRTRAFLFNTLLADKATDDRLRRYPHWLAARNLANEASDESVQALIEAVRGRYEIAAPLVPAEGAAAGRRAARRLRPHGGGDRGRGHLPVRAGARDRARLLLTRSRPSSASWRRASSRTAASTRPCVRPSAAARSARRRCPSCSRTCCSTTPRAAATCSRSPTSSATASTSRSPPARASSTSARR